MVTVFVAAAWWAFARGLHWQLVPWQVLATACAAATSLRWWRPGISRRWNRVLGRVGLLAGVTIGGLGLLFVSVPSLPRPTGQHLVGSQVFRWTDARRPETFTADPGDRREVVAQAWYPTDVTQGQRVPYFEAQDHLPTRIDVYPSCFLNDFRHVETHSTMSPALSDERATWPVVLFSPGGGMSREDYTGLCA